MQRERIELLKEEYTDQYVVVDAGRPEFARFKGLVGQVRTINMNGRALVEFEGRNDRGRYDIELDYLKVVDKPAPKPPPEKPKKAAAAAKGAAKKPAEKAEKPADKPAEGEQQLSALEVARMKDPSGNEVDKPEPKAKKPEPAAEKPVAEKPAVEKPAAKSEDPPPAKS